MALLRRGVQNSRGFGQSESPFTERGFLASAAVIGLVMFAGIAVLLVDPAPRSATTANGSPTRVGSATAADQSATPRESPVLRPDGACATPALQGTEPPTAQPADTRWQFVDGFLLPSSKVAGPAVVEGDTARCYARTPIGAVFAALNGSWRFRRTQNWGAAAQHLLAAGPGRDAYIQQRSGRTGPNALPQPPATGDDAPQPLGFRVLDPSLDRVRVDIVTAGFEGGQGAHTVWMVVWADNDWRLELPSDGGLPPSTPMGPDDAFIEWDSSSALTIEDSAGSLR